MRGMCDEGKKITKGVGGIRVSCYDPVTLLEHGRMRLRAQHVNKALKGGGHICKTHRWPHGDSGHLGSHLAVALRPLGELWCPPGASWHLRNGSRPVVAKLSRYLICFQHCGLLRHSFPALAASRLFSHVTRWSHEGVTIFLNIRPCASNRD
jgi:hypothetical protein